MLEPALGAGVQVPQGLFQPLRACRTTEDFAWEWIALLIQIKQWGEDIQSINHDERNNLILKRFLRKAGVSIIHPSDFFSTSYLPSVFLSTRGTMRSRIKLSSFFFSFCPEQIKYLRCRAAVTQLYLLGHMWRYKT